MFSQLKHATNINAHNIQVLFNELLISLKNIALELKCLVADKVESWKVTLYSILQSHTTGKLVRLALCILHCCIERQQCFIEVYSAVAVKIS